MAETQETLHFLDYWRVIRSRKEIIIAVSLLIVVTGVLVTFSMPKVYRASAVIQVKDSNSDVDIFRPDIVRYDPLFLRTQFEIIQSRPVLEEVIRRRNLAEKLGKAYGYFNEMGPLKSFEQTYKILAGRLNVQHYRDTNLIEIQVQLSEPEDQVRQEVAAVANEVALVYRDQTLERSRSSTERALRALEEALTQQEGKVNEAEQEVERIRREQEIDILSTPGRSSSVYGTLENMSLAQLEAMRVRARTELARKRTRFDTVNNLSRQDLLDAAPHLVGDPALEMLIADKRNWEVELKQMLETMGPNHPDVTRLKARIQEQENKISEALEGLKTGVRADYEAEKAAYEIIEAELEEMRTSGRDAQADRYRIFEKAEAELERLQRIRDGLQVRNIQERIEMHIPKTMVELIAPATVPEEGDFVSPRMLLNVILSVIVGLGASIGLAFFVEYLDTSVKTIEDIERDMSVPVLGVIPQKVKPFNDEDAETQHAEPYRVLRTNVQFSKKLAGGKTISVTSGSVGEGKTLTAFNLAYVCAQLGDRVLIVDSDLHRPRQHKIFGLPKDRGLANVLLGELSLDDALVDTGIDNLDFLPSGKVSSGSVHGLLDSRRLGGIVSEAREKYDLVFFDAPPIIGVSDASLLVRETDAALLVIQHRKYPKSVSVRARDMIENMGANLIGVVLNNINISRDYSYYYHYSYYYYPRRSGTEES